MERDNAREKARKIIHIDMDCFYAAVEMRDESRSVTALWQWVVILLQEA